MISGDPKILVIRFGSLGDLVLVTPLLKALRSRFPAGEIHLACKREFAGIFWQKKNVDLVHTLDDGGIGGLMDLRRSLGKNRYDMIIDAHNVPRSTFLLQTMRAGRKLRINKDQIKKVLLIHTKRNYYGSIIHQVDRYMKTVEPLGNIGEPGPTEIPVTREASERVENMIDTGASRDRGYIAIAPGAKWDTKMWPERMYAELISTLAAHGIEPLLIGGTRETDLCRRLAAAGDRPLVNLAGKLSLIETAALLKRCRLLVTNDSAPLHMSEAVGTPVVAFFGPTVREFGYFPLLPQSVVLETDLPCRPCSRNGARPCPLKTKECLTAITPRHVLDTISGLVDIARDGKPEESASGGSGE